MSGTVYGMTTEDLIAVDPDVFGGNAGGNPICAMVERLPDEQLLELAQEIHQEVLEIAKTNRLTLVSLVDSLASVVESAAYYKQSGLHPEKRAAADKTSRDLFLRFQRFLADAYQKSRANGCDSCVFEQSCVQSHRVLSCTGRVPVEEVRP